MNRYKAILKFTRKATRYDTYLYINYRHEARVGDKGRRMLVTGGKRMVEAGACAPLTCLSTHAEHDTRWFRAYNVARIFGRCTRF